MTSSFAPHLVNLSNNEITPITRDTVTVGRGRKTDYTLLGTHISRVHFAIEKNNQGWILRDLSVNGTLVNRNLIRNATINLASGDIIEFANDETSLKFVISAVPTTNSEPNTDFQVSAMNGNEAPSVSNDHSYVRESQSTVAETEVVDLTHSPENASGSLKRKSDQTENISVKKPLLDTSTHIMIDSSDLECSVCQEMFVKPVTLNCSHSFCQLCINKWRRQRNHCPMCREPIVHVIPTKILDNLVRKLEESMDTEAKDQRKILLAQHESKKLDRKIETPNLVVNESYYDDAMYLDESDDYDDDYDDEDDHYDNDDDEESASDDNMEYDDMIGDYFLDLLINL